MAIVSKVEREQAEARRLTAAELFAGGWHRQRSPAGSG
jgi:hypothetical protein